MQSAACCPRPRDARPAPRPDRRSGRWRHRAPWRISARSTPVVSELPPAPGLSCASAMTTGRDASRAMRMAVCTASSASCSACRRKRIRPPAPRVPFRSRPRRPAPAWRRAPTRRAGIRESPQRENPWRTTGWRRCALNLRQALVQAARGLDVGGLPAQRNQIRQLAQGATGARRAVQPRREQRGRALPGLGHVDVRIGAIADQRVGVAQHLAGHVGMQVQAGDDGHVGSDPFTHAPQQLAFAVVRCSATIAPCRSR